MYKYALKILFLLVSANVFSQTEQNFYSVYFSEPVLDNGQELKTIPESFYGSYKLKDNAKNMIRTQTGDNLICDQTGIYISKNRVLSISREEIRENPKYSIRNGYLLGVIENDSVVAMLDGELYYFMVPSKTYLFEHNKSTTKFYKVVGQEDSYVLFSSEGPNLYSVMLFQKITRGIVLKELIYPSEKFDFSSVEKKLELAGDYPTYVVNPDTEEWKKILLCFAEYDRYILAN